MIDAILRFINDGNQKTTHESNLLMTIMSEHFDNDEIPDISFPRILNAIYQYQHKPPILTAKLKSAKYMCVDF